MRSPSVCPPGTGYRRRRKPHEKTTLRARPRPAAGSLLPGLGPGQATWYLEDGDITIRATENGQTVKQGDKDAVEDAAPVIKQNEQNNSSTATDKTITIDAEKDATANVTLGGVNIDASSRGNNTAGIRTTGDGNVTIELDGNNSVKSAADAAGLQKNNSGNLTIKDDNTTAGNLEASGGRRQCRYRRR